MDALGNLVRFGLLPGNRYGTVAVALLVTGRTFDALPADKAHDSKWLVDQMNARAALICIAQRPQPKEPLEIDPVVYGWRHVGEAFLCNLKPSAGLPCDLTGQTPASPP